MYNVALIVLVLAVPAAAPPDVVVVTWTGKFKRRDRSGREAGAEADEEDGEGEGAFERRGVVAEEVCLVVVSFGVADLLDMVPFVLRVRVRSTSRREVGDDDDDV